MSFLNPSALLFLLLVPAFGVFFIQRERVRQRRLTLLGKPELVGLLHSPISYKKRMVKVSLWLATMLVLVLALARPTWGTDVNVIETTGVSIAFLLDVSNSMNAADVSPSRLERAKIDLKRLFNSLVGNELGLILFAGEAFVQFPMTTDLASAEIFLASANSDSITRQGTNIGSALQLAMNTLAESATGDPIIVVMTDGENFEGDPVAVAGEAFQRGMTIYTIGYGGTTETPIPLIDANGAAGYMVDAAGNKVLSQLDESVLQSIASQTEGKYWRSDPSADEISALITEIQGQEASRLGSRTEAQAVERFGIFVALAVLALTVEMLLPELRHVA